MFSDNFYPELSGITDSIMTTGQELARRGHFINYYVPYYSPKNYEVLRRERTLDMGPRIEIHRLPSLPFPAGTGQGRAVIPIGASLMSLRKFNPDIIHFHLIFGTGLEALLASKILKKPLVGTNHTPITEFVRYSPIKTQWFRKLAVKYDSWFYNHCTFVSSPAQAVIDAMKSFNRNIPRGIVSNPINLDIFKPTNDKRALKKKFRLPGFTVLYAGRLAAEKNISIIIRAIARLEEKIPSVNFVIIGKGTYENKLRRLVKSLDVERRIKFFGFIPSTDALARAYNASDVFVMMSMAETQSIASMQALACRVPVIAAKAWGLKEYIHPDVGFLVEPGNINALTEKISYLYKNPAVGKSMGAAGEKYVRKFSIKNVGGIWEQIYEKVIKDYNRSIKCQVSGIK